MITNRNPLPWDISDALNHARADFPYESCGAIIDGRYRAFVNDARKPLNDFLINDPEYVGAYRSGRVNAIIHSHNNGDWASFADQEQQRETEVPWGIINLRGGSVIHAVFWGPGITPEPLLGRQFFHGVWDCWGLVRDYLIETHGLVGAPDPPRSREFDRKGQDLFALWESGPFVEVNKRDALPGDILLYSLDNHKHLNHCAVYLDHGRALHHFRNQLSKPYPISFHGQFLERVLRYTNDPIAWKTCEAV